MAKKKANIPEDKQAYTEGCDFCMQFDYDDIHVIGASPDEHGAIELIIKAYQDAGVTFVCPNTGKKLRIFARPLTDAGRAILDPSQLPGGHEDIKEF
jgi:hypothetical protein